LATLTPKLGLRKPVVNEETDWGSRLNESMDILDDAVLVATTSGKGTVVVTDDGAGNLTISGTPHVPGSGKSGVSSITVSGVTLSGAVTFDSLNGIVLIPDLGTDTITFSGAGVGGSTEGITDINGEVGPTINIVGAGEVAVSTTASNEITVSGSPHHFSFEIIPPGITREVPFTQQMTVHDSLAIEPTGSLFVEGTVILEV